MKNIPTLIGAFGIPILLFTAVPQVCAQTKFFTAPYGAGNTYNLYEVVTTAVTWSAADTAAKGKQAQATNVTGVAGNVLTGHLVQISSEDENTFVALAAALAPNSGNSNLWIGLNDITTEQTTNRTGWEWSGTTDTLDVGEFSAWATGEPNNAGAGEDAGEMRTDGLWNDNVHNVATTTRRYVIEWEIGSATPISGAREVPVVYTARYGAGNKWNLYRVVATADTFASAHTRATTDTAASTGLASMAGNTTTGHLISLGDSVEAGFAYTATAFGGAGSVNTWLGATDDPAYGGTESNGSPTAGWVWAGDPSTPFSYQSFARRPLLNAAEPNNGGTGENFVELRSDSQWNDIAAPITNVRRYIIEWDILADNPIPGASMGVPFLGATPDLGPFTAGQWKNRVFRNSNPPAGTMEFTINGLPIAASVATNPPAGVTVNNSTSPVINFNDILNGALLTGTLGRSTNGLFWPDSPWPTDTSNVDDNHFVMLSQIELAIPAGGLYTLSIHGDEGFHIRVKPPVGESAMVVKTTGLGRVDAGDPSAAMFPLTTGDSNTRIVYLVSAGGNYVVEYLHYDGTGASFAEVSFAAGSHEYDWNADFELLGGPVGGTPILPDTASFPAPPSSGASWGTRTTLALGAAPTDIVNALSLMAGKPTTDAVVPVINMIDPQNPGFGRFANDDSFPGDTAVDDNNYAIAARGKLTIATPGLYTVGTNYDDNFALRVSGARWRGRYTGFSTGVIDANDPSTLFWISNAGSRAAIFFATAGTYDLDLLFYEGGGGSGIELYFAQGVQQLDNDTTTWALIGDTTAISPIFPSSIPGTVLGGSGLLGTHRVSGAGPMLSQRGAVAALSDPGVGTHTNGLVSKLNLMDPDLAGRAGLFGNDIAIPGDAPGVNDDDFAVQVHGRMRIDVGGTYTFIVVATDGWALRIAGQTWDALAGTVGIDPANSDTIGYNRVNAARDTELLSRARINLPAGDYDLDFLFFEGTSTASAEVFSIAGDFVGLGEYVAVGAANLGDAGLRSTGYRLVGHQANPNGYRYPGMTSTGWSILQSTTVTGTVAPAGWGGTNVTSHDAYLDGPVVKTTATGVAFINVNDPGFGGPGPIPNDGPFLNNNTGANADQNFFVSRHTGSLSIPVDGVYSFGFHGDDGGYFEFLNTGDARPTPTFIRTTADTGASTAFGNISASSQGVAGARIDSSEGGGNQRLVGEVFLAAGTWPIRTQWFEGTGGGYHEIFCSPAGGDATPYVLLRTNGASTAALPDISGLYAIGGEFELTDLNVNRGAGTFTITFNSIPGQRYILEASNSLAPMAWGTVNTQVYGAASATSTTAVFPLTALAPFEIGGRVFVRLSLP